MKQTKTVSSLPGLQMDTGEESVVFVQDKNEVDSSVVGGVHLRHVLGSCTLAIHQRYSL